MHFSGQTANNFKQDTMGTHIKARLAELRVQRENDIESMSFCTARAYPPCHATINLAAMLLSWTCARTDATEVHGVVFDLCCRCCCSC